jgi:cytochrome c
MLSLLYLATTVICLSLGLASDAHGQTQVARGAALYAETCSTCHGADGKRGEGYQTPIWGPGTQIGKFGTAQGLFEYIQILMPFDNPARITDAQKIDVIAYMLNQHGGLASDQTVDAASLNALPIK